MCDNVAFEYSSGVVKVRYCTNCEGSRGRSGTAVVLDSATNSNVLQGMRPYRKLNGTWKPQSELRYIPGARGSTHHR